MGGNNGIGLGNNLPPIFNYPGVGNVGKGFADDGGYGGPLGFPLFGGDGRPFIGAAYESVKQGVGAHKGIEHD